MQRGAKAGKAGNGKGKGGGKGGKGGGWQDQNGGKNRNGGKEKHLWQTQKDFDRWLSLCAKFGDKVWWTQFDEGIWQDCAQAVKKWQNLRKGDKPGDKPGGKGKAEKEKADADTETDPKKGKKGGKGTGVDDTQT